jgi:hypothetical protein
MDNGQLIMDNNYQLSIINCLLSIMFKYGKRRDQPARRNVWEQYPGD